VKYKSSQHLDGSYSADYQNEESHTTHTHERSAAQAQDSGTGDTNDQLLVRQ